MDNQEKNHQLMQEALQQLRDLRSKLKAAKDAKTEPIAIVGMGCRFPGGVENPGDFWELLSQGIDGITEVPQDRFNINELYSPEPGIPGKICSRYGGFIGQLQEFDADFFGIAPREAVSIDPQQRILLEVTWEALENAGIIPENLSGTSTGVFIGISSNDYSSHLLNRPLTEIDAYLATGNSHSTAAGRLAYTLGFTGPCLAVDTACSSSLVAVHLACQSLRHQECDIAVVGGVNRILSPEFSINFSQAKMLAVDGRCKTFDASADGFVRSEGCGVVILQRLSDAIATNKPIQALIRGSAINQDGRSGGLTVPNGPSQQAVIRQALANSLVNPADINYIEAHGTGTALGDPIEIGALGAVFTESHTNSKPLFIGSVKTNIGHLEAAAGIAGLIKVVLVLKHQQIPPHLHFFQPNPHIDWEKYPIKIPTNSIHKNSLNLRFAGVSSFGFSGTNAHVILEKTPPVTTQDIHNIQTVKTHPYHLFTLSAKNAIALKQLAVRCADYFAENPHLDWGDICFSVNTGRSLFEHRLTVIADSLETARVELNHFIQDQPSQVVVTQVGNPGNSCVDFPPDSFYPSSLEITATEYLIALTKLAEFYHQGGKINWQKIYANHQYQWVELPNYPFQRQRYWVDVDRKQVVEQVKEKSEIHPLLGSQINIAKSNNLYFDQQSGKYPDYLQEHCVFNQVILPGAAYLEIILAAGKHILGWDSICLQTVDLAQTCILDDNQKTVQLILKPHYNQEYEWEILSHDGFNWISHATGKLSYLQQIQIHENVNLQNLGSNYTQITDINSIYEKFKQIGIDYGRSFQAINQLWCQDKQVLAEIILPQTGDDKLISNYVFHPVLLDACLQSIAAIFIQESAPLVYLPIGLDNFQIWESVGEKLWSWVQLRQVLDNSQILIADIQIFNSEGKQIAFLQGLQLKQTQQNKITAAKFTKWKEWLYQIEWRNQPLNINSPNITDENESLLTNPSIIAQELAPKFSQLINQPEIQTYAELLPQLETLSITYIIQSLQELGLSFIPGETFNQQQLIEQAKIARSHQQLFSHFLHMLANLGILQQQDNLWCVCKSPDFASPQQQQVRLRAKYALAMTELKLLERCANHLVEVLQGKCQPLQVLFPNGDLTNLTQLYNNSTGAKVMNTLVQQAVITAIQNQPSTKTIRIIEIGGGTGGTTASILPHLLNHNVEYVFTDISPLFLTKAQQQFSQYNFVSYQSLNIEQTPSSQGFIYHSFDIVIAANVLHATSDLHQTITNIKHLLKNQGLLIILEGTRPSVWLDLIFGLTEGWWCFRDTELRPHYPLISPQTWENLLTKNQFHHVKIVQPNCELPPELSQQTVIISQVEHPEITPPKRYLLITDDQGITQKFTSKIPGAVVSIHPQQIQQLSSLTPNYLDITDIIYISQINTLNNTQIPQTSYEESIQLLHLIQNLIHSKNYPTNLWIVTQGATNYHPTTTGLTQSPLWGIGKVIRLEHPELNCRCLDLEPYIPLVEQIDTLLAEIYHPSAETEIIHYTTGRKVARLTHFHPPIILTPPQQPYRLRINQRGNLNSLEWEITSRRQPQPKEVEIQVFATGLNFIDILDASGLLPFDRNWFGVECAGKIVAIGKDVTQFQIGDEVIALASDSFSQYVTIDANLVISKPSQLNFIAAATIPANFITAEYALNQIAKIQPGQSILIHAAASGTGMAAVQIAQQAGLEIFATASPQKWQILRELGVKHIFNSRNLHFCQQILEITNQAGVDIIFNSLSGEFIPASLKVLKPNGHFLEIGKRGVWNPQQVSQIKPHVHYHLIDLLSIAQQQPELIQHLLQRLQKKFSTGELQPLPQKVFPTKNIVAALQMMQQAQHTGKIIITHENNITLPNTNYQKLQITPNTLDINATHLISGGMGGLGLEVADWLSLKGVKNIVLLGRTIPETAQQRIQQLQAKGVNVNAIATDITIPEQVAAVLTTIEKNLPPLRGIIHAAGILDDGVLQQLTPERLETVMSVKIAGAWNLHSLAHYITLDYFIMFSSVASLIGSPGQANHVAANTFLDTLATYRHRQGLPGLSINWGVWSEIGAAAKRGVASQMQTRGISTITPSQGIEILEYLFPQPVSQVGVTPINWSKLLEKGSFSTLFADFQQNNPSSIQQTPEIIQKLQSLTIEDATPLLTNYLQTEVAKVLGLNANQLPDAQIGFFDMGMDSLMMVELRSQIEKKLQIQISSTVLFEHPNITSLAQHLAKEIVPSTQSPQTASIQDNFTLLENEINDASATQLNEDITQELQALEELLRGCL